MRKILKNDEMNNTINKDGFIVIKKFLNQEELEYIRNAYSAFPPEMDKKKYYSTIDSYDASYKNHVNQAVRKVLQRSGEIYFDNYKPLVGNFVYKPKGQQSKVFMHADVSCVDEEAMESVALWVPLVDTDVKNGTIFMMRGSHHFISKYRGPGIPHPYSHLYTHFEENYMEPVNVSAGDAVIFINRIIHFSPFNKSGGERVSFRIDMIPAETKAIMYYHNEKMKPGEIQVFELTDDFYENFRKETKPEGASYIKTIQVNWEEEPDKKILAHIEKELILKDKVVTFKTPKWKKVIKKLLYEKSI